MTVTFPHSGTSARRWRRAFGRAAAVATALLLLSTPLVAAAATPAPVPDGVVMLATPLADGVVGPGDPLTVSVRVGNASADPLAAGTVTLQLGRSALADRAALAKWTAGDVAGVALQDIAIGPADAVAAGAETFFGVMVAPDDPALVDRAPGVYPLLVRYAVSGGELTSATTIIVPDPGAADAPVGIVVPITAEPRATGLATAAELAEWTAPSGLLSDQLAAVDGTDAILAVDPAIPAAIRVLGTAAPVDATAWLERLLALPNSRFALQFGDADLAAQVQAGLTPMRVTSLQYAMDPANFIPVAPTPEPSPSDGEPTPTPTAEPTGSPTDPVYPDLPSLLDIGDARGAVFWPITGTAGRDVVASFATRGTDEDVSLTLVPSSTTASGAGGATVSARSTAGDGAVLVYDATISEALNRGSVTDQLVARGSALTHAAAMLSLAIGDGDRPPLLVTVDRATARSRLALRAAIEAVDLPGVRTVSLSALADAQPAEVDIADVIPDPTRVAAASELAEGDGVLGGFATILDDPTLITGPERSSILQVLGAAWTSRPAEWTAALAAHRVATAKTLDSVGIVSPSTIQLFSPEAPLPFSVRNDLPYTVNVVLFAIPDNLRLNVQRATPVKAGPQSNTRVVVPVQARVGSGDVSIELRLRSPTGQAIGDVQTADVVVRADWEGIGLTVLAVMIAGLLTVGLIRTIRRRRTATAAAPVDADEEQPRE